MNESPRIVCSACGQERARHHIGSDVCKRCAYEQAGRDEALKGQRHYDRSETRYPDVARNVDLLKSLHGIANRERSRGRWWWR